MIDAGVDAILATPLVIMSLLLVYQPIQQAAGILPTTFSDTASTQCIFRQVQAYHAPPTPTLAQPTHFMPAIRGTSYLAALHNLISSHVPVLSCSSRPPVVTACEFSYPATYIACGHRNAYPPVQINRNFRTTYCHGLLFHSAKGKKELSS